MRAIENRRWILRSTNDGITAMIDAGGRVTERLPAYRQLAGVMKYREVQDSTFYTRHGDWFAWLSLAAGVAFAAKSLAR